MKDNKRYFKTNPKDQNFTLLPSTPEKIKETMKHPIQPLLPDEHGVLRFKENKIVSFLLDNGPYDMNSLACERFSQEDYEQFAQLIGYSLSGFGTLSYATDETYDAAVASLVNESVASLLKEQEVI